MIKLVVLDVDGCLSDGKIYYDEKDNETKCFNVKDGLGIVWLINLGIKVAIITGRKSKIVEKRAKELRVNYLFQNEKDKLQKLNLILEKEKININEVAAIGDDFNDLRLLKSVGLSFCPNDAHEYIKSKVDIILAKNGGNGAVREMIDFILKKQNLYEKLVSFWS